MFLQRKVKKTSTNLKDVKFKEPQIVEEEVATQKETTAKDYLVAGGLTEYTLIIFFGR